MLKYLKQRIKFRSYQSKLGLSFHDFNRLSRFGRKVYKDEEVSFFGNIIRFSSPFWFLHSLEEIFIEEVYRFKSDKEGHLIIDCGANIGLSAIYLKIMFPNAKIIAMEPDEKIFKQLKYNIKSFGFLDEIKLLQAAAWINYDKLTFVSEGSVGGHIIEVNASDDRYIAVEALRLKDLLKDQNVFFLKIDIEGAEYEVLRDIKDDLVNVQNLFIEFHVKKDEDNKLDEILKWIKDAGFDYYIKEAWNNMEYPFTKELNDKNGYQMQLNISCFRNEEN